MEERENKREETASDAELQRLVDCLLYTSPSPRD